MADTKTSAEAAASTMRSSYVPGIDGTPADKKFPASLFVSPPQGRLTLTSVTPVLTADATAQTTIYYTPHVGVLCPIYDGTFFGMETFAELSLALDSTAAHTGYHQNGKNFDLFVINDAGTLRLVTGPAWSSDTARGTGAGTTELELKNGIWTNKVTLSSARFGSASGNTVSVAANLATYVGTFRASADGQTEVKFGTLAASGGAASLLLWNAYNRKQVATMTRDSTDSWTYATATWRSSDNSATMRCSFVRGLNEDPVIAHVMQSGTTSGGQNGATGIGLDSTSSPSGAFLILQGAISAIGARYSGVPGLGFHFLQALEYSSGATATFYGDLAVTYVQNGFSTQHQW